MNNAEIRDAIKTAASQCVENLMCLASRMELGEMYEEDVQAVQDAARHVASILVHLRDEFPPDDSPEEMVVDHHLIPYLLKCGWIPKGK